MKSWKHNEMYSTIPRNSTIPRKSIKNPPNALQNAPNVTPGVPLEAFLCEIRTQSFPRVPQGPPKSLQKAPQNLLKCSPKPPQDPSGSIFEKRMGILRFYYHFGRYFGARFHQTNNTKNIIHVQWNHIDFLRVFLLSLRIIQGASTCSWIEPARSHCMWALF